MARLRMGDEDGKCNPGLRPVASTPRAGNKTGWWGGPPGPQPAPWPALGAAGKGQTEAVQGASRGPRGPLHKTTEWHWTEGLCRVDTLPLCFCCPFADAL